MDRLKIGENLFRGQCLTSPNGECTVDITSEGQLRLQRQGQYISLVCLLQELALWVFEKRKILKWMFRDSSYLPRLFDYLSSWKHQALIEKLIFFKKRLAYVSAVRR